MHPSAKNQIVDYLTEFEGFKTWMYVDSTNLVTTGIGILLDPFERYGRVLAWYDKTNPQRLAGGDEVKAEFDAVKSKSNDYITKLRARPADVIGAVLSILAQKEAACRSYFGSDYDSFPADVQVVLTQMSYAGGLLTRKNDLAPLLAARNWLGARDYTYLTNPKQGKEGYKKYNECFRRLMLNAHIVESCSKLAHPIFSMPQDITIFFGFKNALWVSRWSTDVFDPTIREDDIITGDNILPYLNRIR